MPNKIVSNLELLVSEDEILREVQRLKIEKHELVKKMSKEN